MTDKMINIALARERAMCIPYSENAKREQTNGFGRDGLEAVDDARRGAGITTSLASTTSHSSCSRCTSR